MEKTLLAIAVLVFIGIGYAAYNEHLKPVIVTPSDVAVYDSLKNVLAYKKDKQWIILDNEKTVGVLEIEVYRLAAMLNDLKKKNVELQHKFDSVTKKIKR